MTAYLIDDETFAAPNKPRADTFIHCQQCFSDTYFTFHISASTARLNTINNSINTVSLLLILYEYLI